MGLLDNYKEDSLGMAPADYSHYIIIDALYLYLSANIDRDKYKVQQQTQIIPKLKSGKLPDVIVYEMKEYLYDDFPLIFIEVEHTKEIPDTWKNLRESVKDNNLKEAFLFDYKKKKWHKYYDADQIKPTKKTSSWSDVLHLDLNNYIPFLDKRLRKMMYGF